MELSKSIGSTKISPPRFINPGEQLLCVLLYFMLLFSLSACNSKNDELIRAAENGDEQTVAKLLKNGANVDAGDSRGYGALYFSAYRGHKGIVLMLIEKGANVNIKGNTGYTPLHAAAMGGNSEIAELLLDHGAEVNVLSNHQITPLREARGNEVAELLRSRGGK